MYPGQQTHSISIPLDNSNSSFGPGMGLELNDNSLEIGQVLGEVQAARFSI